MGETKNRPRGRAILFCIHGGMTRSSTRISWKEGAKADNWKAVHKSYDGEQKKLHY